MKDMGIRQGSAAMAQPIVVKKDFIYIHTDIKQIMDGSGKIINDLYEYHEKQYVYLEYIEEVMKENHNLVQQVKLGEAELIDTQLAICEIYEILMGGE